MPDPSPAFTIGTLAVPGRLSLAPMAGYSTWPFRSLCRELGSALSYSEFVQARDVLHRPEALEKALYFQEKERPVIYQLYGSQLEEMLEAALRLQDKEPDAIDINLGCPSSSIAGRGAGVGMMRSPLKVARLFNTLSKQLALPLTAKIRLGYEDCQNYRLIARIIAENGGKMIAIHARTKEQRHFGHPDLEAIAEVKQAVDVPVIGNGGVRSTADIDRMFTHTGCDGVMIGRGAAVNPWLFAYRDREEVAPQEVLDFMLEHLERSLKFFGPERGLILYRKHAADYISPYAPDKPTRIRLLTEKDPGQFRASLAEVLSELTGAQL